MSAGLSKVSAEVAVSADENFLTLDTDRKPATHQPQERQTPHPPRQLIRNSKNENRSFPAPAEVGAGLAPARTVAADTLALPPCDAGGTQTLRLGRRGGQAQGKQARPRRVKMSAPLETTAADKNVCATIWLEGTTDERTVVLSPLQSGLWSVVAARPCLPACHPACRNEGGLAGMEECA